MKNLLLLSFLALTIGFAPSCKKEKNETNEEKELIKEKEEEKKEEPKLVVEKKNTSLITKSTAAWCVPSGTWGWKLFDDVISSNSDKAVFIGLYPSPSSTYNNNLLYSAETPALSTAFGTKGYPTVATNGINTMEYSPTGGIYTATSKTNADKAASDHQNAPVVANSNYEIKIEDSKAKLEVKTKFFEDKSGGEYYIAAYLIEDKVKNLQNGQTGEVEHHYVYRTSFNGTWGTKISNTSANSEETFNLELPLNSSWSSDNLKVICVIYEKVGAKYVFVNAR